jgi:hypothetical protein
MVERIKSWLQPPPFAEPFERLCALRLDGTAEWVFETDEYVGWMQPVVQTMPTKAMERFLWIRGVFARVMA